MIFFIRSTTRFYHFHSKHSNIISMTHYVIKDRSLKCIDWFVFNDPLFTKFCHVFSHFLLYKDVILYKKENVQLLLYHSPEIIKHFLYFLFYAYLFSLCLMFVHPCDLGHLLCQKGNRNEKKLTKNENLHKCRFEVECHLENGILKLQKDQRVSSSSSNIPTSGANKRTKCV